MAPRKANWIAGAFIAGFLLLLVAQWARSDDPARGDASEAAIAPATPAGFYPPAPSKAVGMTPEWSSFAGEVDRICATSYNRALGIQSDVEYVAGREGWSDRRLEEILLGIWNDQAHTILQSTKALGEPPQRADLFEKWRANVAKRAELRSRAAEAAGRGDWATYSRICKRMGSLKDRSDEIGQRFGLRICTSN